MPPRAMRSILAAVDLAVEPEHDEVLRTAATLARHTGAALHVVHAVEYRSPEPPIPPAVRREVEAAERVLFEHVRRALPVGAEPATREVAVGTAHRVIVDRAARLGVDLIVLSTHRGGGVRAHFLGTTADRVIGASGTPCWIVRAPLSLPVRRIGVPIDLSDPARRALDLALAWVPMLGGRGDARADARPEIDVIHQEWSAVLVDDPSIQERVLRPRLEREIEAAKERAGGAIDAEFRPVILPGVDPGTEISRYAEQRGLELLVMGTQGRGGLGRTLLGSVASSVARQAPCSVVFAPPDGTDRRRGEREVG